MTGRQIEHYTVYMCSIRTMQGTGVNREGDVSQPAYQKLCRAQALHCEITKAIRIPLDNVKAKSFVLLESKFAHKAMLQLSRPITMRVKLKFL